MIRKLRWKFVLINMVLVTLILSAVFTFILISTRSSLERDSMEALRQAVSLSELMHPGFGLDEDDDEDDDDRFDDDRPPLDFANGQRVSLPYFTVQLVSSDTGIILSNQFFDTSDSSALQEVIQLALDEDCDSGEIRYDSYSMRFLKEETLFGTRLAFVDLSQETSTMQGLVRTLTLVGLSSLAIFFLISIALARWAVRPVEKSWKQQRQFVSDASHELKTPLAVIQSSMELLDQSPDADAEKRGRWMDNIRVSTGQMRTLVEELLVLARSDNATQQLNLGPQDMSDITASSLLLFEPMAFEKGKLMEDEIEEGVTVHGDAAMLKRLVDIYLDNACKYAAEGSTIRVGLKSEGK
ncbi:MAG: hypothetical protein IJ751_02385, partial [Oscillospiraceae bacterium]|nr:hypothetical protein [Oscillospiraceae bacterium]